MKGFLLFVTCFFAALCKAKSIGCRDQNGVIDCSDVEGEEELWTSLRDGFQNSKVYNRLVLEGSPITELNTDIFKPIKAHVFTISENANLTYIDEDAFGGSEDVVKVLYVQKNDIQGKDFFAAIRKMMTLNAAILDRNSFSFIPERGLAAMPQLLHVDLSFNRITRIGREAFADCPHLSSVLLHNNKLGVLPGRILAVPKRLSLSDRESVTLVLSNNQVYEMEPDALDGIETRMEIVLVNNRIQILPRRIFKPLLDRLLKTNMSSTIVLAENPFVCDCRMRWMLENHQYFKIASYVMCFESKRLLESYSLKDIEQCF